VVENRWDEGQAALWSGDLGQRVYTSRLLGADPDLVLHGGGNTSVKSRRTTLLGDEVDVLCVKGSGADLADIDEAGFAVLALDHVVSLAGLDRLSDLDMAAQLRLAAVSAGPDPSVEAILHAILPYKFVDHAHADAVVTLTNTSAAAGALADVYGDAIVVVPYVMPGFLLARACAGRVAEVLAPGVAGMVLMNHGLFTWGDSARESYDRMIDLVNRAEDAVSRRRKACGPPPPVGRGERRLARADLRGRVSAACGAPVVMSCHVDPQAMEFIGRPDLAQVAMRGPITPDHVIRTKPWPLLGRDVDGYVRAYTRYVDTHRGRAAVPVRPLDPAPRIVLDDVLGLCCIGRTAGDARIAQDVYRHTMKVIADATAFGRYEPVTPADLFDVEYWDLEQAKLRRRPAPAPFAGEVALVTGAAGGIGRACAGALMAEGAAVVGLDLDPEVKATFAGPNWLGLEADVTDVAAVEEALESGVARFGGLDMLVLNAGVFPPGSAVADLDPASWRRTMAVNLDANAALLAATHPLLRCAPRGGRVVLIGSKNVPAPGRGAAGYSASKAALTQLGRVAALEWGADGIRVNIIHPNAVFDTGIWTDDVLAERAGRQGMSVEEYRSSNVLGVEVTSDDVARLCVAMFGPAFSKTTGAQVPVDGGNERVI